MGDVMRNVGDAPELGKPDLLWFNVEEPLTLEALRGRLVILDFWTFCCINCIHIIPALRAAEERYPDDLAVIGVHSPKFDAEKDPENVAQAIARYEIVHPVVHDPEFTIWKSYGVRAWPTLVFISPDGQIIGHHSGERWVRPLLGLRRHHIQVRHEQQRTLRAVSPEPYGQVSPIGIRLQHRGLQALRTQLAGKRADEVHLIARWIRGVEADHLAQQVHSLPSDRVPIHSHQVSPQVVPRPQIAPVYSAPSRSLSRPAMASASPSRRQSGLMAIVPS